LLAKDDWRYYFERLRDLAAIELPASGLAIVNARPDPET
jgi:hypothetical protein